MKKEEIKKVLNELFNQDDDITIMDDASLVLQNILKEAELITINCSQEYYDKLKLNNKYNLYKDILAFTFDNNDLDIIYEDKYKLQSMVSCLEYKKILNRRKDKKIIKDLELLICLNDNYYFEKKLIKNGIKFIAGVDEVGRGPLVGPVVAACVVLPLNYKLEGLTDSKKLSEKKREYFYDIIMRDALGVGIGIVSEKIIDEKNIYEATKIAMHEAILKCSCKIEHVLIDAMKLNLDVESTSIIKGDLKSISISAASVIAKVTRDRILDELGEKYPMYDFINNKGYPTKKHLEAINKYGITDWHRRSYGPVAKYLELTKKDM